ncbi:2Fe-2S iron-sulfur cluster-binding protein [Cupriavidus sp. AcVe19-6a]|uniref:2Fe-2S iron-sulfur cluster-binding protein n=1 Tax=Cupriavidus sp. AcVe19-6a TaxID=2821358 RepID=UPI001AEB93E4|nr:2Fe-2S iron-sulfur cluster-binding protein [Cupriavidus sp. AcVe19-6a]MBP0639918.1 2Fe-2S iron-sulfur cluster binding domain-containing protein [Cupriavidus sp. AcVe19-6a]
MYRIHLEGVDGDFACQADDTVLRAGLRAGIALPYECNVGACGTCKFELLQGEVLNLREDAPGLSTRDRAKGRLLGCQARPLGDCTIRLRLDDACRPTVLPAMRLAALTETRDLTHDIREFRFRAPGHAQFQPGQYALLHLPGVSGPRAYSMSNIANVEGDWHFQIRRTPEGAATGMLFDHLRVGDSIEIDGPYGLAYLRTDIARDVVCIAGGSGLAPMLSVARGLADCQTTHARRLHFFYGARTPRDICGEDLLRQLPGFGERISYHATVSAPVLAGDPPWHGNTGFVHELVRDTLVSALTDYEFYLAGPPPMIEATEQLLLVGHGVPQSQIHFDRYF